MLGLQHIILEYFLVRLMMAAYPKMPIGNISTGSWYALIIVSFGLIISGVIVFFLGRKERA